MPILPEDEQYILLAIEEALRGNPTPGVVEVGCVIVKNGRVLATAHNEDQKTFDPSAHAEIVALRRLGQRLLTTDFTGCCLYSTLQPCSMCMAACLFGKIERVVYGISRKDVFKSSGDLNQTNAENTLLDAYSKDIEIVPGVLAKECEVLYPPTSPAA